MRPLCTINEDKKKNNKEYMFFKVVNSNRLLLVHMPLTKGGLFYCSVIKSVLPSSSGVIFSVGL